MILDLIPSAFAATVLDGNSNTALGAAWSKAYALRFCLVIKRLIAMAISSRRALARLSRMEE
jgi:hypothetical protein